jgi:glycosyltransferase involved in cell wall biosynthesis
MLNAADILLLTSFSEGSPQIVKEAMSCNCPIVSTYVGDVRWVIGDTKGCYITTFDPADVVEKIKLALKFSEKIGRTKGRERIIELGLDSDTIAKKIIDVYYSVLEKKLNND